MTVKNLKYVLLWALLVSLIVPNCALVVTEHQSVFTALCNILLPCGMYALVTSFSSRLGRTVWLMFPFLFLGAFQIVLTYLFGRSIIGVDMYLNLITTNPDEVGEMLGGIIYGVILVFFIYVPVLVGGILAICRRARIEDRWLTLQRRVARVILFAGFMSYVLASFSGNPIVIKDDIFPVNVIYNIGLAGERLYKSAHYTASSCSYVYHARHESDAPTTVIFVIGETARASHFSINGYPRNTNPCLGSLTGLVSFGNAMSESNTTHKSVPMLLSSVDATMFDDVYMQKSIITAFKEAGFKTAFFSNQAPNHSLIEFFGNEADTCYYVQSLAKGRKKPYDMTLVNCLQHFLSHNDGDRFVILHTYGSHFNYSDRYPSEFRYFVPDNIPSATPENRKFLVNAYDNSIRYTDYILGKIIGMVNHAGSRAVVLYTSDHGEELFDDGKHFMHASPVPSVNQLHVPFLIWTSPSYAIAHREIVSALRENSRKAVSTSSCVFHTLIQMADINTPVTDRSKSVADSLYRETERIYLSDRNTVVPLIRILE